MGHVVCTGWLCFFSLSLFLPNARSSRASVLPSRETRCARYTSEPTRNGLEPSPHSARKATSTKKKSTMVVRLYVYAYTLRACISMPFIYMYITRPCLAICTFSERRWETGGTASATSIRYTNATYSRRPVHFILLYVTCPSLTQPRKGERLLTRANGVGDERDATRSSGACPFEMVPVTNGLHELVDNCGGLHNALITRLIRMSAV